MKKKFYQIIKSSTNTKKKYKLAPPSLKSIKTITTQIELYNKYNINANETELIQLLRHGIIPTTICSE